MKKHTFFFVCCLLMLFAALIGSCQDSTGPGHDLSLQSGRGVGTSSPVFGPNGNPPPPPDPYGNPPPPPPDPYEFMALAQHVTVEQAKNSAHGTPVKVTGNLVQAIGGDSYIFRDSSGTINMRIGPREWEIYGSTISLSDLIEISGELHQEPGDRQRSPEIHIHARYIRKL